MGDHAKGASRIGPIDENGLTNVIAGVVHIVPGIDKLDFFSGVEGENPRRRIVLRRSDHRADGPCKRSVDARVFEQGDGARARERGLAFQRLVIPVPDRHANLNRILGLGEEVAALRSALQNRAGVFVRRKVLLADDSRKQKCQRKKDEGSTGLRLQGPRNETGHGRLSCSVVSRRKIRTTK